MTQQSLIFEKRRAGSIPQLATWLKVKLLLLAMLCSNAFASAQEFTPKIYDEDCPEVSGSFFIRVYLVYVQTQSDQWASALGTSELQERSRRTMEMLNTAFNPHQIYFVAAPPPNLSGNCYTVYTGAGYPVYDDGITIQILSDDFATVATGQTGTGGLPETFFYVGGNEGGVPASNTPVLIHEMGHCLGLAHTFRQLDEGCDELTDDCDALPASPPNPGYYCNCCGDFVCDTDYNDHETDVGVLVADESCCCSVEPETGISPDVFRNYMSWSVPSRCRDRFTPGQVRRMRCYLNRADESELEEVLIAPETISGSTTWNAAQAKSGVIEIPSGATLTVNAQLSMAPGTYIIVRRGGTLVVNSTITADCGGMWGGVIVEGKGDTLQKHQNGQYSTLQGRMTLNDVGIIEHATLGIGAHGIVADDADDGGGIIEAFGEVRNCVNNVRFGRYRDGSKPNVGFFASAKLILDDNYRGPDAAKPVLMHLSEINRLSIVATWFYDVRNQGCESRDSRADGLVADDAAFRVRQSYFRNLDHAIIASPLLSGGYGSYEVKSGAFNNCYTSIYSALPDPFTILNNYFRISRPAVCPEESSNVPFRGVHLTAYPLPMGIVLSENQFDAGDGEEGERFFGTDCLGAGTMENFIRKNDYEGLTFGNRAAGNNGGATGLRYECNENTDNTVADFYVRSGGSVRTIQGDVNTQTQAKIAAGNLFSGAYSWWNDGTPVTYYYVDVPEQNPNTNGYTGTTGIDPEEAFEPNPNCISGGGECPPPCDGTVVDVWKSQFSQQKSAWLTKTALLPTLTGSAAEALAKEIAAHRSAMDTAGGKVIRNFALDSTGVQVDSVLAWTDSLRRYEADLRLARHHFFAGNYTAYEQWLTDIETRNDLSATQSDELADFEQMLAVVKPSLQAGVKLHRLSSTVLDSLELWASDCTEPGFIAKEILRRNGRKIISECELEPEERPLSGQSQKPVSTDIRLYPNPANDLVFIELPKQIKSASLTFYGLDGRQMLQQTLVSSSPVSVSSIPQGIYVCRIVDEAGTRFHSKLILSH